ncbi:AMP-binding protein [Arthrobacter sp. NPDC097144]|uniref:AMP-binding protein n=1 Tax=Arthrobacter sp. NPDC097144 TaxID=3363946 RepID=UPI0037FCF186
MTFDMLLTQDTIDAYTAQGLWRNKTLTDYLDDAVAATPAKVSTVDPRGSITYAELGQKVQRCALGLLELGIAPGDVISIQLPNWHEWLVIHLAAVRIGALTNPLIAIYRDREVGYMMKRAGSKLLVVPQQFRKFDYPAMVRRLAPELPALERVLVVGADSDGADPASGGDDGFLSWETFMATPWEERRDPAELDALRPDPNALAVMIFTSGTTGEPKGVMHTHNTLVAGSLPWPDKLGMDRDAVIHMASTFAHLTGYLYGVSLPLQLGATVILQDVWNAAEFVELVEQHGIQHTSGATPFLHDLLEAKNLADHDTSSLARFCCMGAPIPRSMIAGAKQRLPQLSVFGGWGQTECCLVTMGHPSDPQDKIINSDGRALAGMQVRVLDLDGSDAAPGVEGRLQVKGPFLFQGYAGKLEQTRSEFDGDWFDTGDLATLDEEGYLRIAGRTKDVIIRGGENIPVAYVENALYEHPKVDAVALVSIPHARLQETACAAFVLKEGETTLTLAEIQAFLAAKGVAKPYWPERVEVVPDFPRTPSGKIQKFQLRERFAAAVAEAAAAAVQPNPAPVGEAL